MKSSISDNSNYPLLCEQAASDDAIFAHFKRNPAYRRILEHVSYKIGRKYLDIIADENPQLLDLLEKFRENDKYGDPITYDFSNIGNFSPTTLRYAKVLSDLIKEFGSLEKLKIIEIGGGYGGQCKIISDVFKFSSYSLVDLYPCLKLSKKYLDKLGLKNVNYWTINDLPENQDYDLIISNYAFSECTKTIQEIYLEKIINKSLRGYMTCNFISFFGGVGSYSKKELITKISHTTRLLPEKPLTWFNNLVLVWDETKNSLDNSF